jgi:hypothetical protein
MKETIYDHRTGETVIETGSYLSQSGKIIDLKAGEPFPVCPDSGRETTWGKTPDNFKRRNENGKKL